jgi:ribonuclease E
LHLLTFYSEIMTSYIAIDASFQWIRTALMENGLLTDVYEESPERGRLKGNIYKGLVRRIDTKIQAAFVKYGPSRDGFLPLKDAERGGIVGELKDGDTILVQVLKDEVGDKGAALTTRLSLSGRALVYLLEKEGEGGVSSRLSDEDRSRLRAVLHELKIPEGASVILRTAALAKSPADLQADLDRLSLLEKEIRDAFLRRKEPGLLWREAPPITRYLREYWQRSFDKVLVNTEDAYAECRNFFSQHEPEDLEKVELSQHGPALFERLGLEETLVKLESPKVTLASGANIVIERTEALVSIDVNSARSKSSEAGRELEENIFRINCEAAAEVARQIRLRDLGGIIVVDFIDMQEPKHRQELDANMKALCARDKAKIKVYGLSPLGLMEINRQRLRKIPETRELPVCGACQGQGRLEPVETQALKALRLLASRLSERPGEMGASLTLPPEVASRLWNEHRQDLEDLEGRFHTRIRLEISGNTNAAFVFQWVTGSKTSVRAPRTVANKVSLAQDLPVQEETTPADAAQSRPKKPRGQKNRDGVTAATAKIPEVAQPASKVSPAGSTSLPGAKTKESTIEDSGLKKSRSRRRKRRSRRGSAKPQS